MTKIPVRRKEQKVTWKHDVTGNLFTKLIPEGETIPKLPRQTVISVEKE